jgi:threonylcarbamoyladenosine tRNA methylthiotransferase MtaB
VATAAFTTLGCKVNQYETQRILQSFEDAGFAIVPFDAAADVYVVNSCSVTSIAESKSRYLIRKANRTNPASKVVVTGCAAQMAINKKETIDGADVIVPNPEKLDALSHLFRAFPEFEALAKSERRAVTALAPGRTRATLKVQDGCSVYCSYCSIPYTRPHMVSRPYSEVLEEAQGLASAGYKEIILTGVLIGAYGPETGSGGPGFEAMVEGLADSSGIERIRISSIEMRQVTPALVGLLKSGKVVPHLHIPLQSGDSGVLKDMNRPYTQEDYLRLCAQLYADVPDMTITTDIMVGFPTETTGRFESTVTVCQQARYLKAHVFRFSPRYGTPADAYGDPISNEEKARRSTVLTDISKATAEQHVRRFVGRTMRVLVEGKLTKDGLLEGLTDNYIPVYFPGPLSLQRQTCFVHLQECIGAAMIGELASQESACAERPTLKVLQ